MRFDVLNGGAYKNYFSWDVMLCSLVDRCAAPYSGHYSTLKMEVHSDQQKSIGLKFSKSRTGSHVTYSCHHNLSRFTFPMFVHLWLLLLVMSEKRVANPQKLKTDLAITIKSLTLS